MCRGVLPDVLAVCVGDLAGDPVADLLVVVVVFAVECGGHVVVCLDELVDRVSRVALGVGDFPVDVVEAALGVGGLLVVGVVPIPAALDTGFRRYDGQVCFGGGGAGDGFPTTRERPLDCG